MSMIDSSASLETFTEAELEANAALDEAFDAIIALSTEQDQQSFAEAVAEVSGSCSWGCANKKAPRQNPKHVLTWNGCGPQTPILKKLNLVLNKLPAAVVQCCNQHDKDYQQCGRSQATSDSAFRTCLDKVS